MKVTSSIRETLRVIKVMSSGCFDVNIFQSEYESKGLTELITNEELQTKSKDGYQKFLIVFPSAHRVKREFSAINNLLIGTNTKQIISNASGAFISLQDNIYFIYILINSKLICHCIYLKPVHSFRGKYLGTTATKMTFTSGSK